MNAGEDNIMAELINVGSKELAEILKDLTLDTWEKEQMLEYFSMAVICPTPKKSNKTDYNTYKRNFIS
jgi:hypothetical protein